MRLYLPLSREAPMYGLKLKLRPEYFYNLGNELVLYKTKGVASLDVMNRSREFRSHFGVSPDVCAIAWTLLDRPAKSKPIHLLWTLLLLKTYNTQDVLVGTCKTTRPTFIKWTTKFIFALAELTDKIIVWENRNKNFTNSPWCRVSVDGTDCPIEEPSPFDKKWFSHKFKKAGLRYEIAVSIFSGDIVWFNGPFPCGEWPDIAIFRSGLKDMLDNNEMVEADNGYKGEPTTVRTRDDYVNQLENYEKNKIRARHETVNKRLKQFHILRQPFRHSREDHGFYFRATLALTQISINTGEILFQCESSIDRMDEYDIESWDRWE